VGYLYLVWAESSNDYVIFRSDVPVAVSKPLDWDSPHKNTVIAFSIDEYYNGMFVLLRDRLTSQNEYNSNFTKWFQVHPLEIDITLNSFQYHVAKTGYSYLNAKFKYPQKPANTI
jgi:hypothetical protein